MNRLGEYHFSSYCSLDQFFSLSYNLCCVRGWYKENLHTDKLVEAEKVNVSVDTDGPFEATMPIITSRDALVCHLRFHNGGCAI